ncbi:MAG: signal peptidase I [Candidatus Thorarchaeota archaeon]
MQRLKVALKWEERSDLIKMLVLLAVVVLVTLGGLRLFAIAMGTSSPLVVVTSGSMEPTLYRGDLLILQGRTAEQISVGDIVVYTADWHPTAPIVHRVVEIEIVDGSYYFYTKGDANPTRDSGYRTIEDIVGVVVLVIPQLGQVSLFVQTLEGKIVVVSIMLILIIVPEFVCREQDSDDRSNGRDRPSGPHTEG